MFVRRSVSDRQWISLQLTIVVAGAITAPLFAQDQPQHPKPAPIVVSDRVLKGETTLIQGDVRRRFALYQQDYGHSPPPAGGGHSHHAYFVFDESVQPARLIWFSHSLSSFGCLTSVALVADSANQCLWLVDVGSFSFNAILSVYRIDPHAPAVAPTDFDLRSSNKLPEFPPSFAYLHTPISLAIADDVRVVAGNNELFVTLLHGHDKFRDSQSFRFDILAKNWYRFPKPKRKIAPTYIEENDLLNSEHYARTEAKAACQQFLIRRGRNLVLPLLGAIDWLSSRRTSKEQSVEKVGRPSIPRNRVERRNLLYSGSIL